MSSPAPRTGDRLLVVIALAVAFLLHLPAHFGWSGGAAGREALYEDGPAVVSNPAFEAVGREGLGRVLARAAADPAAAWGVGDGSVGRSSWRPVSTSALALERWAFGANAARGVAAVSLLLHLAVVLLTLRLLASMDAPRAARWAAGLVVAACPAALSVAAWPARQPILLATAFGTAGLLAGRRGGVAAGLAAGLLLALASLAHEAAFGFLLALLALQRAPGAGPAQTPRGGAVAAAVVLPLLACIAWLLHRTLPPGAERAANGEGIAWLHSAVSLLLPARLHFADGPWSLPPALLWTFRGASLVALLAAAYAAWRRGGSGGTVLACAFVLFLVPAGLLPGPLPGAAPYHDGLLYAALPLGAGAVAWALASAAARGGALRLAAAVAGALWIGANVNATATHAASFRTRAAHVDLAAHETPQSPVVEAWRLDSAMTAALGEGPAASQRLQGLAPRAAALAARSGGTASDALRADPVAAATIASALARFAQDLVASGVAPGHASLESAESAALTATQLVPGWSRPWIVLATTRERAGSLRDAMAAATRASELDPENVDIRVVGVSVAYALGDLAGVTWGAEQMLALERGQAKVAGRRPRADVMLLYARAAAADGTTKAPDQYLFTGLRYRFETAWAVLKELIARGERVEEAQRELYGVCLRYGDFLASKDRTALALVAYRDAAETRVRDTEAAEHETWLRERLTAEERAALENLAKAERGDGNVADALVAVATAFARQAKDEEAAAVFARIEESLGMSPALRYHRAMQLWRELDPRKAIAELRQAVTEDPTLARAHYDLGLLLEEAGELEAALASCEKARSLADAQAETHGAEQWLLDADLRIEEVRQVLRDLGGAR